MPRLRVLRQPHRGKGAAVRAGMLDAPRVILVMFADADLATPPDQLPLLTEALAGNDLALGSRVQPDGSDRRRTQPLHRRACSAASSTALAAAWVTGAVAGHAVWLQGLPRALPRTTSSPVSSIGSIVFDAEIIHLARRRGYSMTVVPGAVVGQARLAHAAPAGPCHKGAARPRAYPPGPPRSAAGASASNLKRC